MDLRHLVALTAAAMLAVQLLSEPRLGARFLADPFATGIRHPGQRQAELRRLGIDLASMQDAAARDRAPAADGPHPDSLLVLRASALP